MFVLITGSRTWRDPERVQLEILRIIRDQCGGMSCKLTVVHGGCSSGVDAIADKFCQLKGIKADVMPADWAGEYRKSAGPIRNTKMVEHVARFERSLCLAFWDGESKGTKDCFLKAAKAGINVRIFTERR